MYDVTGSVYPAPCHSAAAFRYVAAPWIQARGTQARDAAMAGPAYSRRAVRKRVLVTEMCYNGWAIYPRVFHTTLK
jgi:hypothetical protein